MRFVGGAETRRNVLVDGNNLIHRAYYAFVESRLKEGKPLLCSPGGFPTGVIYGFLSMLSSWLYDIPSFTSVSVFFDGVPSRRLSVDPEYKAGRDSHELKMGVSDAQVFRLRDGREVRGEIELLAVVLQLLGCDVYHHPREEADDLIASFVRSRPGEVHVIVSADRDFFQLLTDPRVVCYLPGIDGDRFFDAERSGQHWARLNKGKHPAVPPSHVRMFKALCGDASDAIHGVERLRKRVAVPLCHHVSVDDLYATGFPGFSDVEKEKAVAARDRIRTNYELVGLYETVDLSECRRPGVADAAAAKDLCREDLGIGSLDFSPFKTGPTPSVPAIPVASWLLDI